MEQTLKIQNFSGGMTQIGEKVGEANSAKFLKGLNPYEDPSYITLAKKTTKVSGSTVDNLIHWAEDGSPWDTNRYFYDAGGAIYKETSGGTWSKERTVSGGAGQGFLVHDNHLYYPQATNIGRYGPLDNSPAFTDAFASWWLVGDTQTTGGGTGSTDYVPQTSINEGATHRRTFTSDHDPINSITINVDVVGTGDWTVTLHDNNNRSIGAKTIVNASVSVGDVEFVFSSPLRDMPGESYHFHVTSTVADGGLDTNTNTDHEGAKFTILYDPLISATFHPMAELLGGWAVGNERYIGFFDNINGEYNPTKIALAPGFEVRVLYRMEEYLVAEAWKGQSFEEAEAGRRYFWDGIEATFNYFEDLPMGGPNAATSYRNTIVGIYGNRGSIYTGSKPMDKIGHEIPKLARGKKVEVYPGAIDEYEERLVIGYSAVTDDGAGMEQGVYEHGSQGREFGISLNYPYIISTSTTKGTNLKVGCVRAFGTDLYFGWRDSATYGVDKVALGDDSTGETASWEGRIFDAGDPDKTKHAIKLEITFESLAANETVTPKHKINRTANFTTGTAANTTGDTQVDFYISSGFKEIEYGFDLVSTGSTFPQITGINFIYDDMAEEGEVE